MDINSLIYIALSTESAFLSEYIDIKFKFNYDLKKFHRIIYSLLISIFFNFIVGLLYNVKTIFGFILFLFKDYGSIFIIICLIILLTPVFLTILSGLRHSLTFDENKIFLSYEIYNLLNSKKK